MSDTLRDMLSSAFDASTESEETPTLEPTETAEASTPEAPAASATDASAGTAEPTETPAEAAARARDGAGRFAKKTAPAKPAVKPTPAAQAAPTTATGAPSPAGTPAQAPPAPLPATAPTEAPAKAPQSWTPAAREHFKALPPEVQAEVVKRERQVESTLRESAQHRGLAEAFTKAAEPYRALFTDHPVKVAENLFRTAAQLQTAPPARKAQLVAHLVREYGVPLEALDEALAGQQSGGQGAPGAGQPQGFDPEALLQQAEARVMQRMQQQRQHVVQTKAVQEVEAFTSQAEFLEDVREDVAALLEAASRRGVELNLKDAYNRACWADERIRGVLQQRQQAASANAQHASTQQALAAASSVKTSPASAPAPQDKSLRGSLAAAWDASTGR